MNRRRKLLVTVGGFALAWTGATRAQAPAKVPRIGLLSPFSPSETSLWHQAFRLGLRELGWVEGKNISIEYRYAEGRTERLPELAADLVRLKVDIIVTSVGTDTRIAWKATKTIPIVMVAPSNDPVAPGYIESLARPGGNVTGLSQLGPELAAKRLELLKEMIPKLSRLGVLWNPDGAGSALSLKNIQLPAQKLGIEVHSLAVRGPDDFDRAFADATKVRVGALFLVANPVVTTNLKRIAQFAVKSRMASIYQTAEFADAGGLVAYGTDRADMYRRAAAYVDKILKGAKPGELPVELPTKYELVINLKSAKALGLTIPQAVLMRADRVIE